MRILFALSVLIVFWTLNSCQSSEEIKLKKYMSVGKQLYLTRCSHCHGDKGQGLGKLYPPLDSADYLMNNLDLIPCIIKNGQAGEIIVNNTDYNQVMPGNPDLLKNDIAHIMTYITNAWSNDHGIVEIDWVEQKLELCRD